MEGTRGDASGRRTVILVAQWEAQGGFRGFDLWEQGDVVLSLRLGICTGRSGVRFVEVN